jgi:hypothetical protein
MVASGRPISRNACIIVAAQRGSTQGAPKKVPSGSTMTEELSVAVWNPGDTALATADIYY